MRAIKIFFVIAPCLWFLAACQAPTTYTPQISKQELAAEQERQQQIVDKIKEQGGRKKNWRRKKNIRKQFERVADRLEEPAAKLCRALHIQKERECYYHFKMSRSEDIGAYADGDNVTIQSGMMHFIENDNELAVVMAHEIAHNMMGHIEAGKMNTMAGVLLGLAVDAIASSQGVNTGGEFAETGADIGHLSYSQSFEAEADYVGLYIMARSGYDVRKAPDFWRRMAAINPDGIYNGVTHPTSAERFIGLQKTVNEIRYKRKHRIALLPDFKQNDK